jgi:hypothetical protein
MQLMAAQLRWVEPILYDVYEPSGEYIGQIRFPDELERPLNPHGGYVIRGDTLWASLATGTTFPTGKRYRIRWGG